MFAGVDRSLAIFVVLLTLWLPGFNLHIARGPMQLLLAVALVVLVIELLGGWQMVD
jgi:hypothetical protein